MIATIVEELDAGEPRARSIDREDEVDDRCYSYVLVSCSLRARLGRGPAVAAANIEYISTIVLYLAGIYSL